MPPANSSPSIGADSCAIFTVRQRRSTSVAFRSNDIAISGANGEAEDHRERSRLCAETRESPISPAGDPSLMAGLTLSIAIRI